MSRTPSMTAAECEAAIGSAPIKVTALNRGLVRKWLVACGLPAAFVGGLSYIELQNAYNEVQKHGQNGLDGLRRKLAKAQEDMGDLDEGLPVNAPIHVNPPAPINAADQNEALKVLRDLILNGYKPGVDADQVRSIVQEEMKGQTPRVIEIKHEGRDLIKIDDHVHPEFERCLNYLSRRGPDGYQTNLALVGPAGCGKTHLHKQLAKALGVDTGMISGSAGATESELKGWLLPVEGGAFEYCASDFVKKYESGNVLWNFDEMDGFDANMLMACNVPLANGHMYVQQRRHNPVVKRGENVYFMATLNTFATGADPMYCARNALDEATRDRFIFVTLDYDRGYEERLGAAGGLSTSDIAALWTMRDKAREARLRRVISTRAFQKACILKAAGEDIKAIKSRLVEGWTKDEKAKVGIEA